MLSSLLSKIGAALRGNWKTFAAVLVGILLAVARHRGWADERDLEFALWVDGLLGLAMLRLGVLKAHQAALEAIPSEQAKALLRSVGLLQARPEAPPAPTHRVPPRLGALALVVLGAALALSGCVSSEARKSVDVFRRDLRTYVAASEPAEAYSDPDSPVFDPLAPVKHGRAGAALVNHADKLAEVLGLPPLTREELEALGWKED